ncbi:farnesyl pyrophosphate synthase isoform X2 [Arctopsyche grandis]|uniref:farnesyl pyrophosphate synthase isoform X2 n=1 Tax=Arctopsyche grandis TaxID=121162 RepID=UPI00406D8D54
MYISYTKEDMSLSTLNSKSVPLAASGTATSKDQSREFMAVFPDIVRDLTEAGKHMDVPEASKWLAKVLQYNVPGGKKNRGLALVVSYKQLQDPKNLTPENIKLAVIMGWCVEMFQAFLLVLDDIMDESSTRRGMPCWYKQPNVGLGAINDGLLIQSAMFSVLKKYFHNEPYYKNVLEMFNEMTLKTTIGQHLDYHTSQEGKPDLSKFTMKLYNAIVKYKTAYYTFQMPVSLAMLMSGIDDPEMHRQAKTILLEMGQFFQIQDDFLDCFGDPSVTGKLGSDIQTGTCSWLAVVALQRANPQQKKVMQEHYGGKSDDSVEKIKALYEELGIPNTYATYEETSYNLIKTHIQQISRGLPHALFLNIMEKIYRREC